LTMNKFLISIFCLAIFSYQDLCAQKQSKKFNSCEVLNSIVQHIDSVLYTVEFTRDSISEITGEVIRIQDSFYYDSVAKNSPNAKEIIIIDTLVFFFHNKCFKANVFNDTNEMDSVNSLKY